MKTKLFVFLTAAVLVFSGCSGAKNKSDSQAAEAEPSAAEAERVVIMGEITETVGNMLTLNLIERVEMPQLTEEDRAAMREAAEGFFSELSEEDLAAMRETMQEVMAGNTLGGGPVMRNFNEGGGRPEGGPEMIIGDNFTIGSFPDGFTGEQMPGRGQNYTGETKEIIIPAGAPIYESSYQNGELSETEITLDKLKNGDVVVVTYASDNETVAKVVKQTSTGRTRTGDGGFFGGPGLGGMETFVVPGESGNTIIEYFAVPGAGAPAPVPIR